MNESTNREKVLKRIRQAHIDAIPNPYPDFREKSDVFNDESEDPAVLFARRFIENKGKLIFCDDDIDFAEKLVELSERIDAKSLLCVEEKLQDFLLKIDLDHLRSWNEHSNIHDVIVTCDALIARTGSIVFTYKNRPVRSLVAFGKNILVYATIDQISSNYVKTLKKLKQNNNEEVPDMIHCLNGPARSYEIECREVLGGLAAENVYLFLVNREL